jgi:hypothetical protein
MQRVSRSEIMRRILRALDKDVEKSASTYAVLEEGGLWPRESNVENWVIAHVCAFTCPKRDPKAPRFDRCDLVSPLRPHYQMVGLPSNSFVSL